MADRIAQAEGELAAFLSIAGLTHAVIGAFDIVLAQENLQVVKRPGPPVCPQLTLPLALPDNPELEAPPPQSSLFSGEDPSQSSRDLQEGVANPSEDAEYYPPIQPLTTSPT